MSEIIRGFLSYLIDKQECSGCSFRDTCDELDSKGKGCVCDKAYHSLYNKE